MIEKLIEDCKNCAEGLERDARMYPDGNFPSAERFVNRARSLRTAIAEAESDLKIERAEDLDEVFPGKEL